MDEKPKESFASHKRVPGGFAHAGPDRLLRYLRYRKIVNIETDNLKKSISCFLFGIEPTHKLLLAAGADCILELAAMFCAQ